MCSELPVTPVELGRNDLATFLKRGTKLEDNALINLIEKIHNRYGYINRHLLETETSGFNVGWELSKHGGLRKICREHGLNYRQYSMIDAEKLEQDIMSIYNRHGTMSVKLYDEEGEYSTSAIRNHYGSFNNMLKKLGLPINMTRMDSREEVIDDFLRFYEKYQTTSSTTYRKYGKYSQSVVDRLFGSWIAFIESLNLKPITKPLNIEKAIERLKELYNEYGALNARLINDNCDFTYQALTLHFTPERLAEMIGATDAFSGNKRNSAGSLVLFRVLCDMYGADNVIKEYSEPWLINPKTNHRMYVDFYIKDTDLCFEYDGMQHYEYTQYIHTNFKVFFNQVLRDRFKEKILRQHNMRLIRFRYDEKITSELVKEKLRNV